MKSRPEPIHALFQFLKRHRAINDVIQQGYLTEALSPASVEERALLVMQRALHSQSKPHLDHIAAFLAAAYDARALSSFSDFQDWLRATTEKTCVREGLASWRGWGPKTSALLLRKLAVIEQTPELKKRFWRDLKVSREGREFELPVDAVILTIFEELKLEAQPRLDYKGINDYLINELAYSQEEMLIWDDLWFWGFITQRSAVQGGRTFSWNEGKYWSIPYAPRSEREMNSIRKRSDEFLLVHLGVKPAM